MRKVIKAEINYSKEIILTELDRICSSKVLKPKYRLCQLLKYLIKKTLDGDSKKLIGYTIGIEVFNRPKDFNPELDPIVRIQMGRLRRALDTYYSAEGKDSQVRFKIPIGNYEPNFIPNLDNDSYNKIAVKKSPNYISHKPNIIVLPFTNLTSETEQGFFLEGLTEELSIELARYEDFNVIGFRKNIQIEDYNFDKVLRDLKVNYIIQGSIRKEVNKIKISVRLTDADSHTQLWGEQFKRELNPTNIISIQEDIARETVTIIANEYGIIPSKMAAEARNKPPAELDTYDAILKYYYYQIHHDEESTFAAFTALEQAVKKDPECGVAFAMLASLYGIRYELDLPDSEKAFEKTIELAEKAIELEPNNQFVRIVYAWRFFLLNQKEKFFLEIEKALALNPNSPFKIGAIGFYMSLYGEWEKGKKILDKAMEQNIGFPTWYYGATTLFYYRDNKFEKAYEEAVKYDIKALYWGQILRIAVLGQLGEKDKAKHEISTLKLLKPNFTIKAYDLINRYVKDEKLVKKILEGLQKAGLEFLITNPV